MSNTPDPWKIRADKFGWQPIRSSIKGITYLWIVVIAAVILTLAMVAILWLTGVFTSGIRGQGEAEKVKNSAANRIRAQEGFEALFQSIQAADHVITISTQERLSDPDDERLAIELRGQQQHCVGLVADYNARAKKFTQEEFRSAELPTAIDISDPAMDCK